MLDKSVTSTLLSLSWASGSCFLLICPFVCQVELGWDGLDRARIQMETNSGFGANVT